MINFKKSEAQPNKLTLSTNLTDRDPKKAAPVELDPELTREIIEEEKAFRRGVISVRDIISPASMKIESTLLRLGDKFVRTIFVINYPRYISVGWFAPVINLNLTFDISMFFYPVASAVILKQLKNKVGVLEAQIASDAEKGAARDPLRETALRDIESLRDALTQGTEKFFQFAL
ncbi:MAG: conjugal transfer protein TraC, partial [Candidatus Falkowbacteria bacterium]|nr:conjugal transfer protein TraC [Candidatus Falkowbacteria bacterium]